ncbi:MAG: 50S ribosomal protein L25 [Syntrophaceae bacterium]|nr:50S ribosomal protein L25 [Syntrophaceae bacterium]
MKAVTLNASTRNESGKGAARRLRETGFVPAIFYGYKVEPTMVQVDSSELIKIVKQGKGGSLFVKLGIKPDKGKTVEKLSIIKDLQIDTLKRRLIHADFYEIGMNRKLTIDLSIILQGQPVGIEQGGELQQLKRDVKISGLPSTLPEAIEIDISHLDIGDSIKIKDLTFQDDIEVLDAEDIVIANVAVTRVSTLAEEVEEAATKETAAETTDQPESEKEAE